MKKNKLLDTSNYANNDPLHSRDLASKIGLVKDECGGVPINEIILLQPKCYSVLIDKERNKLIQRAKGVQRAVLKNELEHVNYRNMYIQFGQVFHINDRKRARQENEEEEEGQINPPLIKRMRRIGSQRHQIYTFETKKVALACRDNKRQWVSPNISYAFGHWRLSEDID